MIRQAVDEYLGGVTDLKAALDETFGSVAQLEIGRD
jgi:hypothetical protein